MKEKIIVYEKPTCTTCRVVKKELTEKGVEFQAVNYFEEPLTAEGLGNLLKAAGLRPADAIRKNEPAYKEHVAGRDLDDAALLRLMAKHPELIQRPIVVKGGKAVIPRPIEKLRDLGL
ncbi:MAG TPA: ArsC/Spx/MgsR family protein [Terriglobales bacterium]|nr:ArsC/Spx/MgsR family protein [Terriglobales bacterium]